MKRLPRRWLAGALLALGLIAGTATAADAGQDASARPDLALKGDAVCTRCHDETESYPVLAIGKTRHGVQADGRTPTCTGCHGDSETHVRKPAGVKERPKPTYPFGKAVAGNIEQHNRTCTGCHQNGRLMHWAGSAHDNRELACTSCHQLHTQHDKVKDPRTQPEVCMSCHKEKRHEIHKPSRHPLKEGDMACSDCHNAHGSAGPKLMARDSVTETCYTCHMEKRGPFVRSHQPVTEDCSICHNPHGTTNPNLLKVRPPFLCQECHEPGFHQGNFPGTGANTGNGAGGRGLAQARACLNCHTNIHGTNNPANVTNERTFRR